MSVKLPTRSLPLLRTHLLVHALRFYVLMAASRKEIIHPPVFVFTYVCLFACLSLSQQDYSESMDEFLQCLPTTLVVEYVSFLYADNSLLMYLF